ncbi:transcription elongation factor SPT6-like [Microplitis mediator]|uniref:transcription elongation factor SPT6-like n=1 Tax=Microplitis mediator TaxID=375433 RepID=UPI002556B439|nr:transcription elongation factor SPT6-like [Microplitis mediator]
MNSENQSSPEAQKLLKNLKRGEAVFSGNSNDRFTFTWKVTDDIYQHVEVTETDKPNYYTMGRSLWIGTKKFESPNQIMATHINAMAYNAEEILESKYYRSEVLGSGGKAEQVLRKQKEENPGRIPFIISASKKYPGKFLLSYVPLFLCYHEYVTVTPEGFEYRNQLFKKFKSLIRWFKNHARNPNSVTYDTSDVTCSTA